LKRPPLRRDGGLRVEFRKRLPSFHWVSIETYTLPGVPDSEFCTPGGTEAWIEFKAASAWAITFQPFQASWIDRRARYGGNVWVAVRRIPIARKSLGTDQLWLIPGSQVIQLEAHGLRSIVATYCGEGGPSGWDWAIIRSILENKSNG
jgi:hypothetical protein